MMKIDLSGKIVVVIGLIKGIGWVCVKGLVVCGVEVVINGCKWVDVEKVIEFIK